MAVDFELNEIYPSDHRMLWKLWRSEIPRLVEAIDTELGGLTVSWSDITGTPTTLSGYGITDAYTKTDVDDKIVRPNLIINGDFIVNQRGGTRTPGVGVYGFDRWKGHASGLEQVVEYSGPASDATLSWVGGGTGSLNGVTGTSPITASVSASTNFSVIVPSSATQVQCSLGSVPSPFEYRGIADELARCQRYYQKVFVPGWMVLGLFRGNGSNYGLGSPQTFFTPMRVTPSVVSGMIDTINLYAMSDTSGSPITTSCKVTAIGSSDNTFSFLLDTHPSISNGVIYMASTRGLDGHIEFDAEL